MKRGRKGKRKGKGTRKGKGKGKEREKARTTKEVRIYTYEQRLLFAVVKISLGAFLFYSPMSDLVGETR